MKTSINYAEIVKLQHIIQDYCFQTETGIVRKAIFRSLQSCSTNGDHQRASLIATFLVPKHPTRFATARPPVLSVDCGCNHSKGSSKRNGAYYIFFNTEIKAFVQKKVWSVDTSQPSSFTVKLVMII